MTFAVLADHDFGGRWDSLRDPSGKEWCWSRPDPRRYSARPGDAFVDVGGLEECLPTLAGDPDHGDVWARPWTRVSDDTHAVHAPTFTLQRRIDAGGDVVVSYLLTADPGFTFVWAFHLLVVPADDLSVHLPGGGSLRSWPKGYASAPVDTTWPHGPGRIRFDHLEGDDGTSAFALARGEGHVTLASDGRTLRLELTADDQPVATGFWLNLHGYAWDGSRPYRSIGFEPMIGHHPDRGYASDGELGAVDAGGHASWSLRITAGDLE
jgi:hypothetical protein